VHDVPAFLAVAALVVVTPGVDMALVSKNALQHGRRVALLTALGINAGIVVWTAAAALGVAALIRASATAFTVLKLAGAAYLVFLGLQAIWQSRRGRPAHDEGVPAPGSRRLEPPSGFGRQPAAPPAGEACPRPADRVGAGGLRRAPGHRAALGVRGGTAGRCTA
jgi:threonine/homoserine/homoserine lactone efflux protein